MGWRGLYFVRLLKKRNTCVRLGDVCKMLGNGDGLVRAPVTKPGRFVGLSGNW